VRELTTSELFGFLPLLLADANLELLLLRFGVTFSNRALRGLRDVFA
jgi:hypothetical protein